jgi:hypothetical protein
VFLQVPAPVECFFKYHQQSIQTIQTENQTEQSKQNIKPINNMELIKPMKATTTKWNYPTNKLSKTSKQNSLTLLNQNHEEHVAKQHNHCQSNQERKIQNKHINKHNKPKQPSHQQSKQKVSNKQTNNNMEVIK